MKQRRTVPDSDLLLYSRQQENPAMLSKFKKLNMGVFLATAIFNLFKHKAEFLKSQKAFPAAEGSFLHTKSKSIHKAQQPEKNLEKPPGTSGCNCWNNPQRGPRIQETRGKTAGA